MPVWFSSEAAMHEHVPAIKDGEEWDIVGTWIGSDPTRRYSARVSLATLDIWLLRDPNPLNPDAPRPVLSLGVVSSLAELKDAVAPLEQNLQPGFLGQTADLITMVATKGWLLLDPPGQPQEAP